MRFSLVLLLGSLATRRVTLSLSRNLKSSPSVPWSVLVIGIYLWLLWRCVRGDWWPRTTAEGRRERLRGQMPPRHLWWRSLWAGVFGSVALRCLLDVARRLSTRPMQDLGVLNRVGKYPQFTILLIFLATCAIAGIVEEAAFRGYMQQPIERRYGPKFAVAVTSILFCLAHYRPEAVDPWPWLIFTPAYFAVGVTLGVLAYLTNSIALGVICHAGIDAAAFLRYWKWGVPESVWVVGFDRSSWLETIVLAVFGTLSFWAFARLAAA